MPRKAVTTHRQTPDGRTLASRRIVAHIAGRNIETVAKWCQPVACDVVNRTPLYDADASLATLATRPVAGVDWLSRHSYHSCQQHPCVHRVLHRPGTR